MPESCGSGGGADSESERAQLVAWSRRATSGECVGDAVADRAGRGGRVEYHARSPRGSGISVGTRPQVAVAVRRPSGWTGCWTSRGRARPRTVTDEQVEAVITRTLETTPKDATHWSTRSMAAELGLSQSAVSRIWRAFGLQPHRQDAWKLSTDPQFIDKVRDVVGLYLDPPEAAVVLCVDEKTQIQALDRTAPIFPMLPGTPARASHDYLRAGTSSLYAALDIATRQGDRLTARPAPRDRVQEVPGQDRRTRCPAELDVHVVLDNASTHKTPAIKRWLLAHPRFHLHFTPTSSLLAQPGRTLVRRADHQEAPARHPPQRPRTRTPTSATGSRPGTTTPGPTSGPRPPTRSSTPSPATAPELTTHDTSSR